MPHRPRAMWIRLAAIAAMLGGCRSAPLIAHTSTAEPLPAPSPAKQPLRPIRLTLIGTNDLHGWVYPHEVKLKGGIVVAQGGLASFAGYLANLRADNPGGTLLVDAGDLFQGTL